MSWKGALRSIEAASRRADREALRRQRELERQQKEFAKMQELEQANYEVELYENRIELLKSIHQDCGNVWNWEKIKSISAPKKPTKHNKTELFAQNNLDTYKPSMFDKLFGKIESKRTTLKSNIDKAKKEDEREYQKALKEYEKKFIEWQENVELSSKILNGNTEAYEEAIKQINPFVEIGDIGSSVNFQVINSSLIDVTLHVNSEQVIPSEVKSLLRSGKLSTKQMPKGQFYELYQDYICSCVLRVARELFALLPINNIIVTSVGNLLNPQTGHIEEQPILTVFIPKETLNILNLSMIDPSDSMSNFVHKMNFKRTQGFSVVEKIKFNDLKIKKLLFS